MALLRSHIPPDLVVFDVDGTLHDTFRWWSPIIRAGLQRFCAQNGIAAPMPSDAEAEAVVGMKDAGVWAPFLPEPHKHRWQDLRAVVLPMEVEEVSRGVDYLFAGVRPMLTHLRELGVKVALASNCRRVYMGAMQHGQGLAHPASCGSLIFRSTLIEAACGRSIPTHRRPWFDWCAICPDPRLNVTF